MKTIAQNWIREREEKKGVIAFICQNIYSLLPLSRFGRFGDCHGDSHQNGHQSAAIEVDREGQFRAYVNNRLNILLMWVQHLKPRNLTQAKQHLTFFLHDMEHHFVDPHADKTIRDAFRWLRAFVKAYPEGIKKDRREKAYEMTAWVYEALGIEFALQGRDRE